MAAPGPRSSLSPRCQVPLFHFTEYVERVLEGLDHHLVYLKLWHITRQYVRSERNRPVSGIQATFGLWFRLPAHVGQGQRIPLPPFYRIFPNHLSRTS